MATARVANDAYYTDMPLALAICKALHPLLLDGVGGTTRILEPSAGAGSFVKAARTVWGSEAVITAVEPHLPMLRNKNGGLMLESKPKQTQRLLQNWGCNKLVVQTIEHYVGHFSPEIREFDIGIGNPPYLLAEEHTALLRPRCNYLAFLLRMSFLGSQGRALRIFKEPGLRYVMPIAERPSFFAGTTDNSEYAVFVWQHSYRGLAQILPHLWVGA